MATQRATRTEGVTMFRSQSGGTASYRYAIFVKHEKLKIWLEDRSSKRQWQTSYISKDDYVTAANAFVDATSADYASVRWTLFEQSLGCSLDEVGDVQRKITCLQDDALRLEFCTTIRLLNSARSIRYEFDLHPVAVDRIQILEAKMRDHQEALNEFGARVNTRSLCQVHLSAESDAQLNESKLMWKAFKNDHFDLVNNKRNLIEVRVPGLYALAVIVNHVPRNRGAGSISLRINGTEIQRATTGVARIDSEHTTNVVPRHQTSTSLLCIVRLEKEAQLAVVCANTVLARGFVSYLTVVRITE
ncbi:hypothetical protein ON010_g10017 [Phytophthora cinnamomi]|nr:hypothetical protein ON010_g10017 [Phytophthora cinnamomi]